MLRSRPAWLLLALALGTGLGACGPARDAPPALAPVRLTISAPVDTASVEASTVQVRGRVEPATARVLVGGTEAEVLDGDFEATVDLGAGANVVDVEAGAPRHPAAMTAIRVQRVVPVEIPDLRGSEPEDAAAALDALNLRSDLRDAGGFLDAILPGTVGVCFTDPPAGERVRTGTVVTVATAKSC